MKSTSGDFFPGISGGWNIYKEDFWKALAIHDKLRLKLRASYGVNGNLGLLGDYTAQGSYASGAVYGGASAIQNTVLPNADLRWEQSKTLDFGADIGIFNSRVNILFDVFRRVTDNLVTTLNLPPSTGFGSILTNYGSLEGKGIELELNGRFFPASSAFQWETAITFTKTKNKILKLPFNGVEKNRVGGELLWDASTKSYVWKGGLQEGGTIGELFAYKALGVYATDADAAAGPQDLAYVNGVANNFKRSGGDVIWQDTDGNGTIDARDRVYIGNIYPTMFGGIHNYFTYKNISLTVRMDYTLGHSIEDQLSKTFDQNGAGDISMTINMVKNGWKKQGDVTTVPQYMWLDPKQNIGRGSSAYFLKGDFLALREITLSYTVPASVMKKVGMNSLRLNLTGNNLHYFSKAGLLGGVVPEDGGVDNGRYPLSRNFIFGASLSF
ncbi:TonB-dependent receptor [Flavisolibacter ginsenosidimutans]|uniref:TonB-dependent receptor n=1 Tax=Flavisolibacter ginsenosidimutans TaxID=661481 RepID=A0A5B8UCH7_9BACT|nr:TonB-dependent receptor [Flavisolibacter ginsenosidimutans]QEC54351.1 TonB-dependent receptor [Flavisolibacter ginsenosidimutans]